jgi:Flp pilus assembly protein TadG
MIVRPSYLRDTHAAAAAEFAMVVPVLLLFLLGMIDVGRFMWTLNEAEKATQMGVRYAVVSDPIASVLSTDFTASPYNVAGGDPVPTAAFGTATCTSTGTTCTVTGTASGVNGRNPTAFTQLVTWMHNFYSPIQASNVTVTYKNVGLGFSGDPNSPNVSALTTVELTGLTFQPLVLFGGTVSLPTIKASLTLEDSECSTTGDCGSSN